MNDGGRKKAMKHPCEEEGNEAPFDPKPKP